MNGMRIKRTIFFSNPKVSPKALLAPHVQNTIERIKQTNANYILAIQDTTTLNYTSHKAKTEIGRIGRTGKTDQYGLFQHNTLCVSDTNECLGLIAIEHFHNDDFDNTKHRHKKPIEDKKTMCWMNGLSRTRELLKDTGKKVITVADREGDFFEFLHDLVEHEEPFVVRVKHNRYTGQKNRDRSDRIFDLLEKQPDIDEVKTDIYDPQTHEIKEITLKIKALKEVTLPPPHRGKEGRNIKDYNPIKVNVIKAYNDTYCWILFTNMPVDTQEGRQLVIQIYKKRWHIESFHKVTKTAYQADEIYLHSSREAIENALIMISVSACRLYCMIFKGRVEKNIKADSIFKEYEWKAAYVYFKETIPLEPPSLSDVIIKIARLGGYKPKKNANPPGIKTMWIGFQLFNVATQMYNNVLLRTVYG
jgi:predicted nucleic acid-binding protein